MKKDNRYSIGGSQRSALTAARLRLLVIALLNVVILGCYSPLNQTAAESSLTLDMSRFIGTLEAPDKWVMDVYIFRPEDVDPTGDYWVVTSKNNSVAIDGLRYQRFVAGDAPGEGYISPTDQFLPADGLAHITGIPAGGPYVMLVLIWQNTAQHQVWLTVNGANELVPFTIQGGEITRIRGQDIGWAWQVIFDDPYEWWGPS